MKVTAIILAVILPLLSAAQTDCLSKISDLKKWSFISPAKMQCMTAEADFIQALSYLCSKDKNDLSVPFQKYLSYQEQHQEFFARLKPAMDLWSRTEALAELNRINRDWSIFGYQTEVSMALNILLRVEYICQEK